MRTLSIAGVAAVVLLSACDGDRGSTLLASEAGFAGHTVSLRGQTIGPNGELWIVTSQTPRCDYRLVVIPGSYGEPATIEIVKNCYTSFFSSWDGTFLDGGSVSMRADIGGQTYWLANVTGDMRAEYVAADIPVGAHVVLEAYPYQQCELGYWETEHGIGQYGGNVFSFTAGSGPSYVQATFWCSANPGTGGPGGPGGPGLE